MTSLWLESPLLHLRNESGGWTAIIHSTFCLVGNPELSSRYSAQWRKIRLPVVTVTDTYCTAYVCAVATWEAALTGSINLTRTWHDREKMSLVHWQGWWKKKIPDLCDGMLPSMNWSSLLLRTYTNWRICQCRGEKISLELNSDNTYTANSPT